MNPVDGSYYIFYDGWHDDIVFKQETLIDSEKHFPIYYIDLG